MSIRPGPGASSKLFVKIDLKDLARGIKAAENQIEIVTESFLTTAAYGGIPPVLLLARILPGFRGSAAGGIGSPALGTIPETSGIQIITAPRPSDAAPMTITVEGEGRTRSATVDAAGYAAFPGLSLGTYRVRIEREGFGPVESTIQLSTAGSIRAPLILTRLLN